MSSTVPQVSSDPVSKVFLSGVYPLGEVVEYSSEKYIYVYLNIVIDIA